MNAQEGAAPIGWQGGERRPAERQLMSPRLHRRGLEWRVLAFVQW